MPVFDFKCEKCGQTCEATYHTYEQATKEPPKCCAEKMKRQYTVRRYQFNYNDETRRMMF